MADFVANQSAFADLVRQLSDGCPNQLGKSGGNGAHGMRGRLFYSTTGRAVRQSWGAAVVADTASKHARAAASDPKMRFGTDVFVRMFNESGMGKRDSTAKVSIEYALSNQSSNLIPGYLGEKPLFP